MAVRPRLLHLSTAIKDERVGRRLMKVGVVPCMILKDLASNKPLIDDLLAVDPIGCLKNALL